MVFLGKVEGQNAFVLYSGSQVVLTRSIRRIADDWKSHMAFYAHFNAPTWNFKVGYGGRIIPTKAKPEAKSVGFRHPTQRVMSSEFHDEEAEAVKAKAQEEKREEKEHEAMAGHDPLFSKSSAAPLVTGDPSTGLSLEEIEAQLDAQEEDLEIVESSEMGATTPGAKPVDLPATPRSSATTRTHGPDTKEDHEEESQGGFNFKEAPD